MKKLYRRILFFSSTVVFLAVAPVIILYAIGYRSQVSPNGTVDPLPVGVVLIESIPRRVPVFVNGDEQGRTPQAIPNLPPGPVDILLEQTGYMSWQKTVTIEPARATELRNVRLFPADPVRTELTTEVAQFTLSPDRQTLAIVTPQADLSLLDVDGTAITEPVRLTRNPSNVLWSPRSDSLLLQFPNNRYSIFTFSTIQPTVRALPTLTGAQSVVWDQRIPNRVLVHAADDSVRAYSLSADTSQIITPLARHFATSSRHIYAATTDDTITVSTLQGEAINPLPPLPAAAETILVTPSGDVAVQLVTGQLVYQDNNDTFNLISEDVIQAGWSPSGEMLYVLTGDNALYVYNVSAERSIIPQHELHLVTRLSRPIKEPQWYAGGHHLIYQVEDELLVTEIDTRDHPITYQIDTVNHAQSQATVGEDGDTIFYLTRQSGQFDLIRTDLLVE